MYLRMRLDNSLSPRSVRFFGVRPEELIVLLLVAAFRLLSLLLLRGGCCFCACNSLLRLGEGSGRD